MSEWDGAGWPDDPTGHEGEVGPPGGVDVPEFLLAAMKAAGVDPDAVVAKAAAIKESGGVEAIPERTPPRRRPVEGEDRPPPVLFDVAAGEEARDAAMAQADAAADPEWKAAAWAAIVRLANGADDFTADDVWRIVGSKPKEPRALGPLLSRAQKQGMIWSTGERRNSARPEHHAFPCAVWRPSGR